MTTTHMNTCDYGHQTTGEIRRLPLSRNAHHGNVLICRNHFELEMEWREDRARSTGRDKWEFPTWERLGVVEVERKGVQP